MKCVGLKGGVGKLTVLLLTLSISQEKPCDKRDGEAKASIASNEGEGEAGSNSSNDVGKEEGEGEVAAVVDDSLEDGECREREEGRCTHPECNRLPAMVFVREGDVDSSSREGAREGSEEKELEEEHKEEEEGVGERGGVEDKYKVWGDDEGGDEREEEGEEERVEDDM